MLYIDYVIPAARGVSHPFHGKALPLGEAVPKASLRENPKNRHSGKNMSGRPIKPGVATIKVFIY